MMMRKGLVAATMLATLGIGGCKVDVGGLLKRPTGGGSGGGGGGGGGASVGDAGGGSDRGGGGGSSGASASPPESADDIRSELAKVEPEGGAARVEPVRPGWCDAVAAKDIEGRDADAAAQRMHNMIGPSGYYWSGSAEVAKALCINPDGPQMQQQTAYLLQYWVNMTGQRPEELVPFFRFMVSDYQEQKRAFCSTLSVSTEASQREQQFGQAMRASYGCGDDAPFWASNRGSLALAWHLDREDAMPSEMLRSYEVLDCLQLPSDGVSDRLLAGYAVCGADARALDAKKLEKEIAGDSEWAKTIARQHHAAARVRARTYQTLARAKAKADAGWQTLLFDAPARAWTEWVEDRDANQRAIHAAIAYEERYDGPSRNAAKGCWAQAWGNLNAYVVGKKPTSLSAAKQALDDTVAAVLLRYVVQCAEVERDSFAASRLLIVLAHTRPARGPRWASAYAVIDALHEIKADRVKFAAEPDWFRRYGSSGQGDIEGLDLARGDVGGVVGSVKADGDEVVIQYKKVKVKEQVWDCVDTNKVIGWNGDKLEYEQKCKYKGDKWVDDTHKSVRIPATFADGIAPGVFLRVSTYTVGEGELAPAFPVEVWKDMDRKKLIAFMGIEL